MTPYNPINEYRGLGHDVSKCDTVECIQEKAGLTWKIVPMPLQIVGLKECRPWDSYKALVRSDNGVALEPATNKYNPFQNSDILTMMQQAADTAGVQISRAGELDGGRRVWASAVVPGKSFTVGGDNGGTKVGDVLRGELLMGSGHVPGMALTIDLLVRRLACMNGATVTESAGRFRITHASKLTGIQVANFRRFLENAEVVFAEYGRKARILWNTPADYEASRVFVAQLLQPALFTKMIEENRISASVRSTGRLGDKAAEFNGFHTGRLLDAVIGKTENAEVIGEMLNRPSRSILDLIVTQPGADFRPDSMWNTYNAVTYFVDHERGRTADSGLNEAMFGAGRDLKRDALELAVMHAAATGVRA
jgi:hypothetical protein